MNRALPLIRMGDDQNVVHFPTPLPLPQPGARTAKQGVPAAVQREAISKPCTAHNQLGDPCGNLAVKGSNVCATHGAAKGTAARDAADRRFAEHVGQRIQEMTEKALDRIEEIITDPEDDKSGLAASKDVLDRAGFGAVHKSAVLHGDLANGVDLDSQIEELMGGEESKAG